MQKRKMASMASLLTIAFVSGCGGGDNPTAETPHIEPYRFAQLSHIIQMGQSLGSGDDAFPVLTTADTGHGNFQFSRGIHTWREQDSTYGQSPWLRANSDFDLVPIVAGERATSTGETIASGLVDSLKSTLNPTTDTRFLFSFSGIGSKRLRDLDKDHDDSTDSRSGRPTPGGFYKTSIDDVRRAKAQADARSWSYEVTAVTWMQGEKNNDQRLSDWTPPLDRQSFIAAYADDLIKIKNDWNVDIQAITGQTRRIPLFSYQTWGAISGQAQLAASDKDAEIFIVSPTYYMRSAENEINPLNGLWGNWIHLNGDSQRWLGAQFAKVMKRVLLNGEKWQPLRPIKAWASPDRRTVYVKYHVPKKPIVIDTEFLPELPGAGLFIKEGPTITSAIVIQPDTVELILESPLPASQFKIQYASELDNSTPKIPHQKIHEAKTEGYFENGQPTFTITYTGRLEAFFHLIATRGSFYLINESNAPDHAKTLIRSVQLDTNGNTVLQGETRDLQNGVMFQADQYTNAQFKMPFGNIRDSDAEPSIYAFAATQRMGQPYPLWNWSVAFQDLDIADSE